MSLIHRTRPIITVPAIDKAYAKGLSLWQHKGIRRYAQSQLNARTDIVALAQAKAEIRALVERDFDRKSTHGRKRHARFLENHSGNRAPAINVKPACDVNPCHSEVISVAAVRTVEDGPPQASTALHPPTKPDAFSDDEALPVFEANLDLPRVPVELDESPARHQA